ncbi:class I SAM-dependent methyltransferase [Thiocapsa sp.]|uniref:class I SAM-dependent DNA methyltransferase n=1 Tax=Thiocapsa sp. TaxID=2024551 RepID=UPI003592FDFC
MTDRERVAPYSRLATDYDRLVGDALYPTVRASFDACVRALGLRFGSLADVGCGTGRFLRAMLGYGVPLIGVDRSAHMLRIAAERLRGQGVLLMRQDMRRLRLPHPVDLFTCNGDTLNDLLVADELASTLLHCRKNLRPGGHLIADLLCGRPTDGDRILSDIRDGSAGRLSLWRTRSDRTRRLTRVEIDFGRPDTNGETRWTREIHDQRWHRPSDLDVAAKQAGLRLVLAEPLVVEHDRRMPAAWIKIVLRRAPPRRRSARDPIRSVRVRLAGAGANAQGARAHSQTNGAAGRAFAGLVLSSPR